MTDFIRVTDEVSPRREYTIPASAFDPDAHEKLNKDAIAADGSPLPAKYTPGALAAGAESDVPPTEVPSYDERTVKELEAEIDARNASRPDAEHISKAGNKPDLVAALSADDTRVGEAPPSDDPQSLSTSGQ